MRHRARRTRLGCSQPRFALEQMVTNIDEQGSSQANLQCASDHDFLQFYGTIASALFNVFAYQIRCGNEL